MDKAEDLVVSAYRAIKEWAIDNYTGQPLPLPQENLAKQFGMSKTPIREALNRLTVEGLAQLVPNRGYWVPHLTAQDIQEIYVIREALEGVAARTAAETIDESGLGALHLYFDSVMNEKAQASKAIFFENAGEKLHCTIIDYCRNARLSRILENLHGQLDLIKSIGRKVAVYDPSAANAANEEHLMILEALSMHNPDNAEKWMRIHLQNSRVRIVSAVLFPHWSVTGG